MSIKINKAQVPNVPKQKNSSKSKKSSVKTLLEVGFSGFAVTIIVLLLQYFIMPPKTDTETQETLQGNTSNNIATDTVQNSVISNSINSPVNTTTINNYNLPPKKTDTIRRTDKSRISNEQIENIDNDIKEFNSKYGIISHGRNCPILTRR